MEMSKIVETPQDLLLRFALAECQCQQQTSEENNLIYICYVISVIIG